jgi:hypothetical protein
VAKLKKFLLPVALLAFTAPLCRADEAALERAAKFAQAGEWDQARKSYQAELAAHPDPATLPPAFYYDYGTALARAGASGEAYVHLLRAAFASPFDGDARHNLHLVENQVPMAARAVQPATWMSWWPESFRVLPWKLWVALGLLATAAALALARLTDRSVTIGAAVIGLALLLCGALTWAQARSPVFGVVALAKVKSGPGSTFSDITTLEAGSLVNQEAVRDGWLKIRFVRPDSVEERVGWVEPLTVLRIL